MKRLHEEPRVVIGMPLASPLVHWRIFSALLEMEKPPETDWMVFQGALVDRARNELVRRMLGHPIRPTHLLFLDSDILPPPDTLRRLLKVRSPIVSGLYRRRIPPHEPMAFRKGRNGILRPVSIRRRGGLLKVDCVGAGCLLIERGVFRKIRSPWFESVWRREGHLSEDFAFCEKARAAGFEIRVDPAVRPLHLETVGVGTGSKGGFKFFSL